MVIVPEGETGGAVVVNTGTGSNSDRNFTLLHPTWYLAEGSTAWGFDTYITIENPNDSEVTARMTYMDPNPEKGGATAAIREIKLPKMSQTTVDPREILGAVDFSTKVECLEGKTIAVDRTMSWTGKGASSPEGHSSIGATSASLVWYLPEGSSDHNFETWTLVQNPNSAQAHVNLTYMIEGETPQTLKKVIPAHSRATYSMEQDIGSKDASVKVSSNQPVIAERAMYRNNRREGHCSVGAVSPAQDYYLAEGSTSWGFTTYVLIQNPNDSACEVTLTCMTPEGNFLQDPFTMPANSRKTLNLNGIIPDKDVSTLVHGSAPVIAERAMYWDFGTGEACHDSIGMSAAHKTFYLPDGQTSEGRETYTLVQNPNDAPVTVEISYLTNTSAKDTVFKETIGARSRMTYSMADRGVKGRATTIVRSLDAGKKIMVERSMYWNKKGAGTNTIGGFSD
ncbi:MAG: hypothetical protein CVT63_00385 [Candidatus Anoxymicrobium japonicum]|uniref:Uncharacterized protein n=1 Tax=Candidatus Anoxymicrobium japonicum TaxID=2013648 RepID=A0A2N3G8C3_9ACTN|nr:MAG: hypothetical protein CVT63_00385 [Candidatus Anoxymicrobium japonicum]